MPNSSRSRAPLRFLLIALVAGSLCALPGQSLAQLRIIEPDASASLQTILSEGQTLETEQKWGEAASHYERAMRDVPGNSALQDRYDWAKLHYDLARRYNDSSYVQSTLTLDEKRALELYHEVLLKIDSHYVKQVSWQRLVARGTQSLDVALTQKYFIDRHMRGVTPEQINAGRRRLHELIRSRLIYTRQDAQAAVAVAARQLKRDMGVPPGAVVLEYVSGASGGLDPYSTFLTSGQLKDVYSQIDGNFVGLGIELKSDGDALLVVSVIKGSPAQRSGIRSKDRIMTVDGKSTADLSTDAAAALLQGPENSTVRLTLVSENEATRSINVRREHVEVPSIEDVQIIDRDGGVGYLKLVAFQRSTSRDLDTALWKLYHEGMKSLVIDVRGNPGGLLSAAVDVADKFVERGTIVSTRGRSKQEDYDYQARRLSTWQVPLVVLIDDDSASASEIFAAAVRDNRRGTIVGQRSYGKGSVQGIFPLGRAGSGLRLTTAKFYGPNGRPISNVGVSPDVTVQVSAKPVDTQIVDAQDDAVLNAGIQAARRQVALR